MQSRYWIFQWNRETKETKQKCWYIVGNSRYTPAVQHSNSKMMHVMSKWKISNSATQHANILNKSTEIIRKCRYVTNTTWWIIKRLSGGTFQLGPVLWGNQSVDWLCDAGDRLAHGVVFKAWEYYRTDHHALVCGSSTVFLSSSILNLVWLWRYQNT